MGCRFGYGIGSRGGIPTAAEFTPAALGSKLALWHRGDTVAAVGSTLTSWTDKSGNGKTASAAEPPTLRPNGDPRCINGLAVVDWDGTNRCTYPTNAFSALTAAEVFLVGRIDADPPALAAQSGIWQFGTAASGDHFPFTDGTVYAEFGTSVRKTCGNPAAPLTSAFLLNIISTPTEWTLNINGTQVFTTATNTVAFRADCTLGSYATASIKYDGVMADMIMCGEKLTADERANVKAYVTSRYAIALT